ncbi:hypothetical protein E1262_10035 [Jiangella aurantiaca]|uniref:Uncharacterized protein n=1 Tax=Jiangella aurantiaca TaxID=2530373 RepID=A0A4V2YSI0_9ACTN|nr:hypothetical protein [Jiangella aurantiaca]TDD70187.1 hypothetical protein E1262_10035 [Jiangella aurantiaca]
MTLPSFALLRPTTLDEALRELSEDVVPYCGGTELCLRCGSACTGPTHWSTPAWRSTSATPG